MRSERGADRTLSVKEHVATSVVLIALGFVSQPVLPSISAGATPNVAHPSQAAQRTPDAGKGIITGVVVNERQEPVARAQVQAFPVQSTPAQSGPLSLRASGSA